MTEDEKPDEFLDLHANGFIKYCDVERFGSEENTEILDCEMDEIVVEEKVDGGNGCFFKASDGSLHVCSRNRDLTAQADGKAFGLQQKWLHANIDPSKLNDFYYYFEHMQKHSINYGKDISPVIGLDIRPKTGAFGRPPMFLGRKSKEAEFERLGVPCVSLKWSGSVKEFKALVMEDFAKTSAYYDGKPEGIVVKNYGRTNAYGRQLFAKLVNDDFKELNRATFGGLKQTHSDSVKFADYAMTDARIEKFVHKLVNEGGHPLDRKLMQWLPIGVIEDMFKEETKWALKECDLIDLRQLKTLASKKCIKKLDEMIVFAHRQKTEVV